MPQISIVTALYRSSGFLEEFLEKCYNAAALINCTDFEIVMVNDGSPDDSLKKALELKKAKYSKVKVVDLSRNFGHHYALLAGINSAKGDHIFLIDCDLEISPEVLVTFYEKIKATDCDVVYGYQEERKGKFVEKRLGGMFWKIFNALSDTRVPASILTERLMNRKYVDALVQLGDKSLFLAGMFHWAGFIQVGIPVTKLLRKGQSTYTLKKRIKLVMEAITTFSGFPLKILFNLGLVITFFSFMLGCFLIIRKILYPSNILTGFTSLSVMLLFSTGLIIFALGIIGVYIDKIYTQTKNRPTYIIKDIYL